MIDAQSKMSKYSRLTRTPVTKKTKYDGEDQMQFGVLKPGEVFGHLPYVYPAEYKDTAACPFTIKTNEKTRLLIIQKAGISLLFKEYLMHQFKSKF